MSATSAFNGKTVYITGGGSGLGLAAAQLLAARGAHIALFGRRDLDAACQAVRAHCADKDQSVIRRSLDVTDRAQVKAVIDQVAQSWRAPDFVIHAAGIPAALPFFDAGSADQFDQVIATNLFGTQHVCQAVLPWLEQTRGRLMLVGSMAGVVGCYGYSAYGTSKYAVRGLAEALRYEYAPRGVSIGLFAPGEFPSPLLDAEYAQIHPATRLLKKMAGQISQDQAAHALVRALPQRKTFEVTPGFMSRLLRLQLRLLPQRVVHAAGDAQVAWVLRKHPDRR